MLWLSGNKKTMRSILFLIIALVFNSCSKENRKIVRGTVILQEGCAPGAYLVKLTEPDPKRFSFLCSEETSVISSAIYHCGNAVFILDMPTNLAVNGKKIRFSSWTDKESFCSSSNLAPHYLQVQDLAEE